MSKDIVNVAKYGGRNKKKSSIISEEVSKAVRASLAVDNITFSDEKWGDIEMVASEFISNYKDKNDVFKC